MSKITPDNIDKWLFNLNEGNLTPSELKKLDEFLATHPEYKEDAEAWKSTHFSEKLAPLAYEAELHALAGASVFQIQRRWAVAAGLLLLFGGTALYFLFNSNENVNTSSDNFSNKKTDGAAFFYTPGINENVNQNPITGNNSNLKNKSSVLNNTPNENQTNGLNNTNSNLNNTENITAENVNGKQKHRNKVHIDIQNDIVVTTEKIYETVVKTNETENEEEKILTAKNTTENNTDVSDGPDKRVKLDLKENNYSRKISDRKALDKKRRERYKLDPNPSFTNLRDPQLLMTDNHLINQYGGFSGGMISSRFSVNYRNTWTGAEGINSQTALFSYDKLIKKLKTGVAFTAFYSDYNQGMFNTMGAAITVSPKFKLGRGTSLEPAVTFSYAQKTSDADRINSGDFIEDRRGNVLQIQRTGELPLASSAYVPDLKAGAVFQHKRFWAATSIDHLFLPKETLYSNGETYRNGVQFKMTFGTDYLHRPESGNVFSPQMTFYHHDGYTEMWLGSHARFKQFSIGGSFSQYKDFLATAGYQTHSFKVFYQYDKTRSLLMNEKIGSHEIGLRFALNGNNRNSKSILNNER